jgi:hypothetical protein
VALGLVDGASAWLVLVLGAMGLVEDKDGPGLIVSSGRVIENALTLGRLSQGALRSLEGDKRA